MCNTHPCLLAKSHHAGTRPHASQPQYGLVHCHTIPYHAQTNTAKKAEERENWREEWRGDGGRAREMAKMQLVAAEGAGTSDDQRSWELQMERGKKRGREG